MLDDHPHTRVGQWICESFGSAIRVVMTFPLEVSFVKLAIDLENQLFVDHSLREIVDFPYLYISLPEGMYTYHIILYMWRIQLGKTTCHKCQKLLYC